MKTKEYDDVYGWIYRYDRNALVWRAFYATNDVEVNQYHKCELFFLMGHIDDELVWNNTKLTQVPVLTMKERTEFLAQVE